MRLIDADALKEVLMETKAQTGNVGEVVAMIFCGIIDEQPEAEKNGSCLETEIEDDLR